jgi:hypothetical protein
MTNSEKPPAPEVVISTVGLNLKALIAAMEREAFEAWYGIAYDTASLRPIEDGCYTKRGAGMAWDAWQARAAHQRPCRGVAHAGCDYLSACGDICNKCGQAT